MARKKSSKNGNTQLRNKTNVEKKKVEDEIQNDKVEDEIVEDESPKVISFEGLTQTQKKNLKRRLKNQEKKKTITRATPLTKKEREALYPNDPNEAKDKEFLTSIKTKISLLRDISALPASEVTKENENQAVVLNGLIDEILLKISSRGIGIVKPENKKLSAAVLCEQLHDFKLSEDLDKDEDYCCWLENQLEVTFFYENWSIFRSSAMELKSRIEKILEKNSKVNQSAKETSKSDKVFNKVSQIKKTCMDPVIYPEDKIKAVTVDISGKFGNIGGLLIKNHRWLKSMERQFGCLIESNKNGFVVTGYQKDVEKCTKSLNDLDLSGKERIDEKGNKVGQKAINIRTLEDNFDVYVVRDSGSTYIVGSEQAIADALNSLQTSTTVVQGSRDISVPLVVAKTLQFSLLPTVRVIEQESGTSIRISFGERKESGEVNIDASSLNALNSHVIIKGKNEGCDIAMTRILELVNSFVIEHIQGESKAVRRLFSPPGKNNQGEATRMIRSLIDEFNGLRASNNMSILRVGDCIVMVGPKDEVNVVKPKLSSILKRASYECLVVESVRDKMRLFSDLRKKEMENAHNVNIYVNRRKNSNDITIEIVGNDESNLKAKEAVLEHLNKFGNVSTITVSSEIVNKLLSSGGAMTRSLSVPNELIISVNRSNLSVSLIGIKSHVLSATEKIMELTREQNSENDDFITEEITIPEGTVGTIIGHRGVTINKIRSSCNCSRIEISKGSNTIVIKGSAAACAAAKTMVSDLLEKKSDKEQHTQPKKKKEPEVRNNGPKNSDLSYDEKHFPSLCGATLGGSNSNWSYSTSTSNIQT